MEKISITKIHNGIWSQATTKIIFWHPIQPGQTKAKVADILELGPTRYLADGFLIPKIVYAINQAKENGWLYSVV